MHRPLPLIVVLLLCLASARADAAPPRAHAPAAAKAQKPSPPASPSPGARARATAPKQAPRKVAPPPSARSVGHPNDGRLEGGVRLDTSRKELRVVPAYARDDVRWGLPALVHMIERAARGVAKRYPGAVLDIGDLSRRGGGEVHRHHSHESGRDADIGFYAVDAKGKQVQARAFIPFDERLASTNVAGARFDAGRNWLLVQHLLTDREAHVSHIFVAEHLKQALLAEAKRRGVSRAVLVRAQLAMMQPTGVEPHDDHMHVRISCPRAMRGKCVEIAKNAPTWRDRVARTGGKGGGGKAGKTGHAARTQAHAAAKPATTKAGAKHGAGTAKAGAAKAGAGAAKAGAKHGAGAAKVGAAKAGARPGAADGAANAPAAARGAAQQPMAAGVWALLRGSDAGERDGDGEAEADGAEVRDALDDSGEPKITD